MSEIKYSKDSYDTKMGYLNMMNQKIELVFEYDVTQGSNVSINVKDFVGMYEDIKNIMRYYKWSLEDAIASMQSAGDALYLADGNAKAIFEGQ